MWASDDEMYACLFVYSESSSGSGGACASKNAA